MAREKVDNKLNVVIGTKAQVEGDTSIPENSIVVVTDEELKADEIVYSVEKNVKEAIEDLEDEKVDKADIVDNLTTDDATKVLSAKQGKELNDTVALKVNTSDIVDGTITVKKAEQDHLGNVINTTYQLADSNLDTLAGLAKTDGNFIVGNGTTWTVESDATARTSLDIYSTTEVDNYFIPKTEMGTANGVATLDGSGKIPPSQLSEYIRGGIRIQGTMGAPEYDTVGELISALIAIVGNSNDVATHEEMIGYAWIASKEFTLNEGTLPTNTAYIINPGDEGDSTPPIVIEVGDMILVSNYSFSSPTHTWTLSVINNTYEVATSETPGIVKLVGTLTQDDLQGLDYDYSDEVITAAVLGKLTQGGDVSSTLTPQKLVTAGHTHSAYQLATNKAIDFSVVNDIKYPTTKAVKDLVDAMFDNLLGGEY